MTKKANPKQQNTRSSSGLSEDISLDEEKKRKFFIKQTIYALYYITRISLAIAIIVIINRRYVQQLFANDSYLHMQQNIALWKQDIIVDITTVYSYNCPEGYETYTSAMWPGTEQGCYCSMSLGTWDYTTILQGGCSSKAISSGCIDIPSIQALPFLFWKNQQLICLKRVNNLNFFTNLKELNVTTIGCASSNDFQFDFPSIIGNTQCPITQIQNNTSLNQQLPQINFSYDRQSEYPIIMLKMTEYQFCPYINQENISPNPQRSSNYELENIVITPCIGEDQRVIEIDQQGEDTLFSNNPKIQEVTNELPGYPEPSSDYIYKLGYVRYPDWKYSCRSSSDYNMNTTEDHLNLEEVSATETLTVNITVILMVVYGFLWTIFYLYRKISELYYKNLQNVLYDTINELQRKKPNLYEKLNKSLKMELILCACKLLVGLGTLIAIAVLTSMISEYLNWYQQSKQCTSTLMVQWLQQSYISYFESEQNMLIVSIVLVLSLMFIDCLMFCWRSFKGDLRRQDKTDPYQKATNIFDEQINDKQLQFGTNFSSYNGKESSSIKARSKFPNNKVENSSNYISDISENSHPLNSSQSQSNSSSHYLNQKRFNQQSVHKNKKKQQAIINITEDSLLQDENKSAESKQVWNENKNRSTQLRKSRAKRVSRLNERKMSKEETNKLQEWDM